MILQLNNPLLIGKILELARIIPDIPVDVLEKMLLLGISDKDSAIYIFKKDDEIIGIIFASKETWMGKKTCFIQVCAIKPVPKEKFIGFELLMKIRLWAKEKGLKDMIFVCKRNYKPFTRKYKFALDGFILKRSVL